MKKKLYFIIKFNDLSNMKQLEMEEAVHKAIQEDADVNEYLDSTCDIPNEYGVENIQQAKKEHITGCVWKALNKMWAEIEVEVNI